MNAGNRPPGMVPAKAKYMGKDIARISQYFKIPLRVPSVVMKVLKAENGL